MQYVAQVINCKLAVSTNVKRCYKYIVGIPTFAELVYFESERHKGSICKQLCLKNTSVAGIVQLNPMASYEDQRMIARFESLISQCAGQNGQFTMA